MMDYWFPLFVILAAMIAGGEVRAAAVVTPSVGGYSGGNFSSPSGSFGMTAANDGFTKPAVINVGGRSATIPASLRMAANAGTYAKAAMRLNPGLLVGTLALGWLLDNDMDWDGQEWTVPGGWVVEGMEGVSYPVGKPLADIGFCACTHAVYLPAGITNCYSQVAGGSGGAAANYCELDCSGYQYFTKMKWKQPPTTSCLNLGWAEPHPGSRPAGDADWDALPDPLPAIAPETPDAPYMPEGVPVSPPEFEPADVPLGDPYTKPDGSTAEPRAKITPNPSQPGTVNVDTYEKPLTDANGDPVPPGTPPVDTSEPVEPPPMPDLCKDHPDILACAKQGETTNGDIIPTHEVPFSTLFSPVGSAGGCPADVSLSFMGQPLGWSYEPICTMADMIRPLVIGFAWLGFGFIIVAGLKK